MHGAGSLAKFMADTGGHHHPGPFRRPHAKASPLGAEVSLALHGCDCDSLVTAGPRHMIDTRLTFLLLMLPLDCALRRPRVGGRRRARPGITRYSFGSKPG